MTAEVLSGSFVKKTRSTRERAEVRVEGNTRVVVNGRAAVAAAAAAAAAALGLSSSGGCGREKAKKNNSREKGSHREGRVEYDERVWLRLHARGERKRKKRVRKRHIYRNIGKYWETENEVTKYH